MKHTDWFDRGYFDLVSIIPPGATLSAQSTIDPKMLGKIPGRLMTDDTWAGYNYITTPAPTRPQVEMWGVQGANLGILSRSYPAIDIDVDDPAFAAYLEASAIAAFGAAPVRTRGTSRRLLMYRASEPFTKRRVVFEGGAIDILGDGQQYLLAGTHPSGAEYVWNRTVRPVDLIDITAAEIDVWVNELRAKHGAKVSVTGDRELAPPQEQLRGDFAQVAIAVGYIPNTERSRDTYIRMGAAIKGAIGDTPDAFTIWWDWCQKLPDGRKTPSEARDEWSRIKPPFAVGAQYLIDLAREHGYAPVVDEFAVIAPPPVAPAPVSTQQLAPESDAWLANAVVETRGNMIRYCTALGGWLVWDGHCWAADDLGRVRAWVGDVCQAQARCVLEAQGKGALVEAKRLCSSRVVSDVLRYVQSDPRVATAITAFDLDPWVLNTPAGVVDLRTGELGPSDARRLMTRCTAVAPVPEPPHRWLQFLGEVTRGDYGLVAYLQRLVGYALTGSTNEEIMAFLHGPGGNGKSVFLNTIVRVLGTYAKVASMTTFTASKFDQHPADLATLVGARLVTAQETQEGRAWDETKVKAITGGDPITARLMRENPFTYTPQFTLLFAGNHRPHFATVDDAMRRRFHLVPFTVKPAVVDRLLDDKLKPELPGILAWAIEGAVRWQQAGLRPPPVVTAATQEYFLAEDPLGRWMIECTVLDSTTGTELAAAFTNWRAWCGTQEEHPGSERAFARRLRDAGRRAWVHGTTERVMFDLALRESVASFEVGSHEAVASSPLLD